ncbi:hypothetical protein [Streptomyces rubiginosohelvolus]|uniref:Uncharacterized protein n=1 Tax=Streptomyces rubiginosohelvolus TaxID=67362 RepID=A0ABQ3C342_9ACTN|nr:MULTISPECIES: hypothetical protein [Streptomyces]GGR77531.1 hypothetical protein GCM10010284_08200 [Streptomyces rubiginosohelvolus]GGZ63429.1 hypothetical protein GCM10010328_42440 [Streptomyces pluricolorescens]
MSDQSVAAGAGLAGVMAHCGGDYGHDLDTDAMRDRFAPWFHALDVVSERDPVPESLAAMARLPRACGRYELALALCDRADAVDRVMWTALARAATPPTGTC